MNWHFIIWTLGVWAVLAGVYQLGWRRGRRYGQDEQWVDDVIAMGKLATQPRDECVRFKSISGKN